jgi:hypothetical protein
MIGKLQCKQISESIGMTVTYENNATVVRESQVVYKHRGAIEVANSKITKTQRLAWNLLLAHAFRHLLTRETHSIPIQDIAKAMRYKNITELKQQLKELRALEIEYNIAEEETWGISGYLAAARIQGNMLHYAYDPFIREQLADPKIYAKIQLSIEHKFSSKYSIILYELAASYYIAKRRQGDTKWYDLGTLRRLMGCDDDKQYQEYKHFSAKVLKKAISEINSTSDLRIQIEKKTINKRTVTHVRFHITPQPSAVKIFKTLTALEQKELPFEGSKLHTRLVSENHLSPEQATHIVSNYDEDYIIEKLTYIASQEDNVDNLAAYTYAALTKDYGTSNLKTKNNADIIDVSPEASSDTVLPPQGTIVKIYEEEYTIDEGGFAVKANGAIPIGKLKDLLKKGQVEIL